MLPKEIAFEAITLTTPSRCHRGGLQDLRIHNPNPSTSHQMSTAARQDLARCVYLDGSLLYIGILQ